MPGYGIWKYNTPNLLFNAESNEFSYDIVLAFCKDCGLVAMKIYIKACSLASLNFFMGFFEKTTVETHLLTLHKLHSGLCNS